MLVITGRVEKTDQVWFSSFWVSKIEFKSEKAWAQVEIKSFGLLKIFGVLLKVKKPNKKAANPIPTAIEKPVK